MRIRAAVLLVLTFPAAAQNRPRTYTNPLPLPSYPVIERPLHRSMADPTVIRAGGKYYLYPSYGMAWVSENLVDWAYRPMDLPDRPSQRVFAPHVFEHKGRFYLTGNALGMYAADAPLGPWQRLGDIIDHQGKGVAWVDPMLIEDSGHVYAYYGSGKEGVQVVELEQPELRRFRTAPRNCFRFDPAHVWERWGDSNEFEDLSWIEGAWVTRHAGTYHLQYSGPGTEWKTYAIGVYTSRSPLGPFQYDVRSPIFKDRGGLINGVGHHSVVEGPGGNLWAVYTLLYRNHDKFERRIGLDPAGFDESGNLVIHGPSETPQWAPGIEKRPWLGNDAGEIALSINKAATASSAAAGRDPIYAVDNSVRTWWTSGDEREPWLAVDLAGEFTVTACRVLWAGIEAHRFRIEVSTDGGVWRSAAVFAKDDYSVAYVEFPARRARQVRLVATDGPAGVLEFTVFGR